MSTEEPARISEFAQQLMQKAFTSGKFMFADIDLKFDQPQARVIFNRDKLRAQGVDLAQAGRESMWAALRQPLLHPGPELQGHPAGQAQNTASTSAGAIERSLRTISSSRYSRQVSLRRASRESRPRG